MLWQQVPSISPLTFKMYHLNYPYSLMDCNYLNCDKNTEWLKRELRQVRFKVRFQLCLQTHGQNRDMRVVTAFLLFLTLLLFLIFTLALSAHTYALLISTVSIFPEKSG